MRRGGEESEKQLSNTGEGLNPYGLNTSISCWKNGCRLFTFGVFESFELDNVSFLTQRGVHFCVIIPGFPQFVAYVYITACAAGCIFKSFASAGKCASGVVCVVLLSRCNSTTHTCDGYRIRAVFALASLYSLSLSLFRCWW